MVVRALDAIAPDAVLIEGPPDAAEVLPLAAHAEMVPPVALLVYDPDTPANAAYYPFAEFSPEWQALRWGYTHRAAVRCIDLPQSLRPAREPQQDSEHAPNSPPRPDPLEALAHAAGYTDGEAWWGRLIEERRGDDHPLDVFRAIHDAMATARAHLGPTPRDPEEPAREAHMRKCIRAAMKEGFTRIAVICGAWHAPALTHDALKSTPAKADLDLLKGRTTRATLATWIPWTYDRLSFHSGYGAGITSPGWYEHLWQHHDHTSTTWLTKVARFLRDEDLDASPASVIEAVRLADTLAALRGRARAALSELSESTLAILCHANPLPMRTIEHKLIVGVRLGDIPDTAPHVPLQRDLAAQQRSLRLKVSADETILDLDQRKDIDLARSRLLHRLTVLSIPWGTRAEDQKQRSSTFHEVWTLQWKPEFAVAIIEASRWGNTVQGAAAACVTERAAKAKELAELTTLLDHVMLADLPGATHTLITQIQSLSTLAASITALMDALPALARILRYGNVRKTDAALVAPLVDSILTRICSNLLPACSSLDDDAARDMRQRLDAISSSLTTLANPDLTTTWHTELLKLANTTTHALLAGRAWRILLDAEATTADSAATHLSLALSPANDPAHSAAWIDGFLTGSGATLVHDAALLSIIDTWVCSLPQATFDQVCPIARRTFATFSKPERRMIGEALARTTSTPSTTPTLTITTTDDTYDPARGALVDPVLTLILAEHRP